MTRDDITRMALEAGFSEWAVRTPQDIERFAALVAADEREACAKVCDKHWDDNGQNCAAAIRERGQK